MRLCSTAWFAALSLAACTSSTPPPATNDDASMDVGGETPCSGAPAECCKDDCGNCSDNALREIKRELCVDGAWTCPLGMVRRTRKCTLEEICAARGGPRVCCDACGRVVPTTCPPGSEWRGCPAGATGLYDETAGCPAPEAGVCTDGGTTDAATPADATTD